MSHIEKSCQLCAVSFNIGRVRTTHEPLEAGWDPTGSPYHLRDASKSRCLRYPKDSGCKQIVVKAPPNIHVESRYQHLAGPGCTFEGGYNGNKVGDREMRGMNRARYILRRPREVERDGDEEEYERGGEYFVSAETTGPPVEDDCGALSKERYGIGGFMAQNYPMAGYRDEDDVAIPVHDACWKIFERVSMKALGRVDLEGFVGLWWRESCGGCGFQGLNQDPVLKECKEKWWVHRRGTEYLAANPVDIPGFRLTMHDVFAETSKGDGTYIAKDSRGPLSKGGKPFHRHQNETDPFTELPTELKNKVLSKLSAKDIANLRLSSRSFRQLPKQIFKQFITEDIPWFWEVNQLKEEVEEYYQSAFAEEYGDDLDMLEGVVPHAWFTFVKERLAKKPMDINWHQVYNQLKVLEKGSLGLRNRARIWNVTEEVVGKITAMRAELTESRGSFTVHPAELARKGGPMKSNASCPRCAKVQIELEDGDDSRHGSETNASDEGQSGEEDDESEVSSQEDDASGSDGDLE